LPRKKYGAKLDHNANAERAERAKKRYHDFRAVEQELEQELEAAENVESLLKAVFQFLRSPSVSQFLRQKNREIETKGMRRPFLLIRRP